MFKIEQFVIQTVESMAAIVLSIFAQIKAGYGDEFETRMGQIASQPNFDKIKRLESSLDQPKERFAGGLAGNLLQNLCYRLGLQVSPQAVHGEGFRFSCQIAALVLKRAMELSGDFDLYVRSLISGALVIGYNFKRREEAEFLESLIEIIPDLTAPPK